MQTRRALGRVLLHHEQRHLGAGLGLARRGLGGDREIALGAVGSDRSVADCGFRHDKKTFEAGAIFRGGTPGRDHLGRPDDEPKERSIMIYRILSLDGGGAWALIQVKTLMALFGGNASGHDVLASFDLVAANSGGSLTLAGLAENKRLSEILDMFRDETKRRSIFSPTRSLWQPLYKLIGLGPKYSAAAKLPAIRKLLPVTGDQALPRVAQAIPGASGQPVHLLIVGFDYDTKRAVFFRSAEVKDRPVWGSGAPANCTLAEAVHVSTNAPIDYFDAPAAIPSALDRFWDGGITGCNNPAVAATIEAITQDVAAADIRLLSIGTGTVYSALLRSSAAAFHRRSVGTILRGRLAETRHRDPGRSAGCRELYRLCDHARPYLHRWIPRPRGTHEPVDRPAAHAGWLGHLCRHDARGLRVSLRSRHGCRRTAASGRNRELLRSLARRSRAQSANPHGRCDARAGDRASTVLAGEGCVGEDFGP